MGTIRPIMLTRFPVPKKISKLNIQLQKKLFVIKQVLRHYKNFTLCVVMNYKIKLFFG